MSAQNSTQVSLILKMPSSELKNIVQLNEAKNALININDALHDGACSGYYTIIDWYVDEEDDDQVVIYTRPLKGSNIVQLFSPEALNNPELFNALPTSPTTPTIN